MKKLSLISVMVSVFLLAVSNRAEAWPVPTFSPSELAQQVSNYMTTANHYKTEVENTKNLIQEGVLKGVPGYIKSIEQGNWTGLIKGLATDSYNTYKVNAEKRKKAKDEALEKSKENAQQNLLAQQEGQRAAEKAIDENREKAANNIFKKAYTWGKNAANKTGSWVSKNKSGLQKINNSTINSDFLNNGMDSLSKLTTKQGNKS